MKYKELPQGIRDFIEKAAQDVDDETSLHVCLDYNLGEMDADACWELSGALYDLYVQTHELNR